MSSWKCRLKTFKAACHSWHSREKGITMIETLVALALLGAIACAFLGSMGTASKATIITDEQTTAKSLDQSQMEHVKALAYEYDTPQYSAAEIPSSTDYLYYSATINATPLHNPDDGIQKITVTVKRSERDITTLEGYKLE